LVPSVSFATSGAWLVLTAIEFNLTRAGPALSVDVIASVFHAQASTATIRRHPIAIPARLASFLRRLVIHLANEWPWTDGWVGLFNAACGPPTPATT
jgi:hypothetical protein